MTFVRYIKAFSKLYSEIKQQRVYNRSFLVPYIRELEKKYNGKFSDEQLKKITAYYGLFIPAVLCAGYKRLYNDKLTEAERKRAALFGILTPVGDDLFDVERMDAESIRAIAYTPESYTASSFPALVAKEIQTYFLQNVTYKEDYLQAARNVFEIQLETEKQTDPLITDAELERITYAKGGYSVVLYHRILDNEAEPLLLQALYEIGALMQLTNDIFDMYKDLRDGIVTLPNRCTDFSALKHKFLTKVKNTNRLICSLPFEKKNKEEFCVVVNFILSRGIVALNQMIRLEKKTGRPPDCRQLPRKELIFDMQKPVNIIRWLFYIYRLPQLT